MNKIRYYLQKSTLLFILAIFLREFVIKFFNRKYHKLSNEEIDVLKVLKRDGIVVLPNYFSTKECELIRDEYDKYVSEHSIPCVENERRIFGINKLSDVTNRIFSQDKFSKNVCETYLGESMVLQTTMVSRIDYSENDRYGSGGSWHRDSYSRQIKSIAYLTDMDDENGPFMYIKGSHKFLSIARLMLKLRSYNKRASETRYTDSDMEKARCFLSKKETLFTCSKGTLILADIRGLHTTRFLKSGHAYSIFNYYIAKFDHDKNGSIMKDEERCLKKTNYKEKDVNNHNVNAV